MATLYLASSALVIGLTYVLALKHHQRKFIHALPGPPSTSWLVGNTPDLDRVESVGDKELKWVEKYGTAFKFKGALGQDILYLADPKALQYVLNTGGYNFHKAKEVLSITRLFTGKGLAAVEGSAHARHRKIMNPAFAYAPLRGFLPIFSRLAQKAANKWRENVIETGDPSPVIDVTKWLRRLALDIIGEAVLNVTFGAVDNTDNELMKVYDNLVTDAFHSPSNANLAFRAALGYLPQWFFFLLQFVPLSGMKRVQNYLKVAFGVARRLVNDEMNAIANGKPPGKDAMSILVRANSGENPKGKLSDHELLSEMTTLMIAGHDTSSSALTFFLYELSRHPDYQNKIREEIKVTRDRASSRGDDSLSITDLESMVYTVAAMKETLRLRPIALSIVRIAGQDDTIPLSTPQRSLTGELFTAIPVSKGQKIMMSIVAYNRLEDLWGPDTDQWRPDRFINNRASEGATTGLGVYANLATFGSGLHSCIGWRFALLEIQTVVIELLGCMEFAPAPGNIEIIAAPAGNLTPMVKGQTERGTQLPLQVIPL